MTKFHRATTNTKLLNWP